MREMPAKQSLVIGSDLIGIDLSRPFTAWDIQAFKRIDHREPISLST